MNAFERACRQDGYKRIAGIDEAGRGALAGPVVAAAVILPVDCKIDGLKDSKQLTPKQRSLLANEIRNVAISVGVSSVDNRLIEELNILQAALRAMAEAVQQLTPQPDYLLVDGSKLPKTNIPAQAIPKGDNLSLSIAAASVIAKTTRDKLMIEFHQTYPNYGFAQHKGYPTAQHRQAIAQFGASAIHRNTFKLLSDA
ncbi:MAG: ribonuclease HII [Candidatus Poribacteria bacterium]|nr:ribonuclease HII [Candidatus Poribacteria bacterium]